MKDYTIEELGKLAEIHHKSGLKPQLSTAQAFCVMQKGVEAGIAPMTALQHLKVVRDTVTIYAEGMRALILGQGHRIDIEECTDKQAKVTGYRKESPDKPYTVTFTFKDAEKAGLTKSNGRMPSQYELRPNVMLLARATTRLGREYFADAICGLSYTPEEVEEIYASEQDPPPAKPQPEPQPAPESPPAPEAQDDSWKEVYANWQGILDQIYGLSVDAGKACDERLATTFGGNLADLSKKKENYATVTESLHKWLERAKEKFGKAE